jgi:S1-C subfamily serine protease
MNKILPIILVVVLSGCTAGKHALMDDNITTLEQLKQRYFPEGKQLDLIEGIWNEGETMVAIIKNPDNRYQGEDYLGFVFNSPNPYLDGKTIFKLRKSANNPKLFVGSRFYNFSIFPPYDMEYERSNYLIDENGILKVGADLQWSMIKTYPTLNYSSKSNPGIVGKVSGTGFYINNNGYIVTNFHVIKNCTNISILKNADSTETKIAAKDEALDLALLKADVKNENYISISGLPIEKLQRIIAAGYPFGKYLNDDLKVTSGIVSSLKGPGDDSTLFQMDAALNFGNSGGPVVDEETGNLIGVAVSIIRNKDVEGINYAIKNSSLRNFLQSNSIDFEANATESKISRKQLSDTLENSTVYITCN